MLRVTPAYAREYMIQHYAYAPVSKRDPRELSRYPTTSVIKAIILFSFASSLWQKNTNVNSFFYVVKFTRKMHAVNSNAV